jgi:uncharacterized membrane-anchored protein
VTSARHTAASPSVPNRYRQSARRMLNKVPEITLYFWIIKVLCTTVGETGADYLNETLGFGLTKTTVLASFVLVAALVVQFRVRRYVPGIYWLAVVLISIVGTLITDNLTDNFGVSLVTTTVAFSIVLACVFAAWYASERTLSIHTIVTTRREGFYWLTVLFTFALGTAAGDLTAERLAVGYWKSGLLFAALIAIVYVLHRAAGLNAILAFWIAYILTRPLGASIGDYLSQPRADGGLGLGTTLTSAIFLLTILAVVVYLSVTRVDVIEGSIAVEHATGSSSEGSQPGARILVIANKAPATSTLVEAVRARAARGVVEFVVLVPNPAHVAFDRNNTDLRRGDELLSASLPQLEEAAGGLVVGRVATSPNAYDDIVQELNGGGYDEIILETSPSHLSHWLHVDLPERIALLGYPLTTVVAAH